MANVSGDGFSDVSSDRHGWSQATAILLAVLLAGSLCLNIFLAWQLRRVKRAAATAGERASAVLDGIAVSRIHCTDFEGKTSVIDFAGSKPTVLYIFNPKCHWCALNLENIRTLAKARGDSFRFIGLSLNSAELKDYFKFSGLGFPVYSIPSYSIVPRLKLGSTPQMILISRDGKVVKNWVGALAGKRLTEVEAYFGVPLPGIPPGEQDRVAKRLSR